VPRFGSDLVHTSDPVPLLGFPDYAKGRPARTEEVVATHDRSWIKSDAGISHGHSGAPHHSSRQRRLDLHLAGDAPLSGRRHRHQVALSEGGLDFRQPPGIGGPGPVDHQEPAQELVAPRPHRQAVPGKDLLRPRVPEEENVSFANGFFCRFPFLHGMIVSRGASGSLGQIRPSLSNQLGLPWGQVPSGSTQQ
jgi:hypothetical protein